MSTTWKPAWQGMITGGDAWEAIVSPGDEGWTWDAECFHRFGSGRAPTEAEAKAAALTWIADTLREVSPRAAVALGALTGKAPVTPSQVLTEHIERYEAMRAQISEVPDSKRKTHDLAYLDGAISSLRMARTIINAPYGPDSASESATLPETPPAATERPAGLVWR